MSTDTTTTSLIINKLTKAQYTATTPSDTELYIITDDAHYTAAEMAALLADYQPKIKATALLSADLVDDTSTTHKFVTADDKTAWSGKQDKITASAKLSADLVDDTSTTHKFVTSAQLTEIGKVANKQDKIDADHKLSADLMQDGTTNKTVTATEKSTWSGKQDAIADLDDIRSGAALGATALQSHQSLENYYTKTEVNGLVSSVYKYKGSKATYAQLPTTGNVVGDVWNVEQADATNGIKAGDNVAWTGTAWDVLAGTTDLSNYVTKGTTLSHYGITDAKIENGVITLGANTITPLTAHQSLDGKQDKIDADHKLDAALVATTDSLQFVTSAQKTAWTNKQDAISDLATIRSGAAAGATAVQPGDLHSVATSGNYSELNGLPTIPTVTFRQW